MCRYPTMTGFGSRVWLLLIGQLVLAPWPSVSMSYKGYQMFSVPVRSQPDVERVVSIKHHFDKVAILDEPHGGKINLVAAKDQVNELRSEFRGQGMEMELVHEDIQSLIDATTKHADGPVSKRSTEEPETRVIDHLKYHRYTEIVSMLEKLAELNPDLMEVSTLQHWTHDGRKVAVVKVHGNASSKGAKNVGERPAIVIEAGIHAREWISPAVNLWVIEQLLSGYRRGNLHETMMLDTFDWYIIPVTNPDGYEFTHTEDRLWRKNRRYISRECRGVDLNRNFDVAFNTTGISNDCLSIIYLGFKPFSEPETSNVKALVESLRHRLVGYLAIHSYSQLIIVPWGYTEVPAWPDNYKEIDRIAQLMESAIRIRHGTVYTRGQAYPMLGYAASGAAEDWALQEVPGIFSVCLELRPEYDDPRHFLLPPDEIVPSAEEYFDSLVVMANELAKNA